MKTVKKVFISNMQLLKNFFFIWNYRNIPFLPLVKRKTVQAKAPKEEACAENHTPGFEEYREMYMTRCRWS